ncbi:hypothetical protein CEXT_409461 [Caerostris extrusa]|uniref:Uncharacterized protein n=1 Tax=Caerostris extrusa TaxID=172846 RepID=A0AAV4S585_CAEEX|nr:hypothetical protein CEXT_409461 [Caerostris extrusa]
MISEAIKTFWAHFVDLLLHTPRGPNRFSFRVIYSHSLQDRCFLRGQKGPYWMERGTFLRLQGYSLPCWSPYWLSWSLCCTVFRLQSALHLNFCG